MSTTRSALLRRLAWSTALAGVALATPALGAPLPTVANIPALSPTTPTFKVDGTTVAPGAIDGSGTQLDVTLTGKSIINWNTFNIDTGKTVSFTSAAAASVLNRVAAGAGNTTTIAGTLTSSSNVKVYLINPNGLIIGDGANINVGALFASTRNVTDLDFTTPEVLPAGADGETSLTYANATSNTAGITLSGANSIITTGGAGSGQMVLIGASVTSGPQTTVRATGDVAFVAADSVTVSTATGSPLSMTISSGTTVQNAVALSGTVSGRNVTVVLAPRGSVTDTLLSVDGLVTATGAVADGNQGVVLTASNAAPGVTLLAGATGNQTASPIRVIGKTAAIGTISSAAGLTIAGASVTLGAADGSARLQSAAGAVDVTASRDTITGRAGLTLQSDRNGAGNNPLTLRTAGSGSGNISFAAGSTLVGGTNPGAPGTPGLESNIQLRPSQATSLISLGNVIGRALGTTNGAVFTNGLNRQGAITVGDVDVAQPLSLVSSNNGLITGGALQSGGAVTLTGGAVSITSASAGATSVQLTGNTGDVTATGLLTGPAVTVNATAGTAILSGDVTATAGDFTVNAKSATLGKAGSNRTQQATGAVGVTATNGIITGTSNLTLRSNSDATGAEALTLTTAGATGGTIDFAANSSLQGGTGSESDVQVRSRAADSIVTLGNVTARGLLGAVGAGPAFANGLSRTSLITVGDVDLTAALSLTGAGISAGKLSSDGSVTLTRAAATTGALTATQIQGAAVTITDLADVTVAAGGTGDGSVTADTGDIGVTTAGAATFGALHATAGAVTVGSDAARAASLKVTNDITAGDTITVRTSGDVTVGVVGGVSATANGAVDFNASTGGLGFTGIVRSDTAGVKLQGGGLVSFVNAGGPGDVTVIGGSAKFSQARSSGGDVLVRTTGAAGATNLPGNLSIVADTGKATVEGNVTVTAGNYNVSGRDVVLGDGAGTDTQKADGAVNLQLLPAAAPDTGTPHSITGKTGLVLQADADAATDGGLFETLSIDARYAGSPDHVGFVDFTGTQLLGGTAANRADVSVLISDGRDLTLGAVTARQLVLAATTPTGGSVKTGDLDLTNTLTLTTPNGGTIETGKITIGGGSLSLTAPGGSVTINGKADIDGLTTLRGSTIKFADLVTDGATIQANDAPGGGVSGTSIDSTDDVLVEATTGTAGVTVTGLTKTTGAGHDVTVTSTGKIALGQVDSAGTVDLTTQTNVADVTLTSAAASPSIHAASAVTINSTGNVRANSITSDNNKVTVNATAGQITGRLATDRLTVDAGDTIDLHAGALALLGGLTAKNAITVTATGSSVAGVPVTAIDVNGNVDSTNDATVSLSGDTGVSFATVTGGDVSATATGGAVAGTTLSGTGSATATGLSVNVGLLDGGAGAANATATAGATTIGRVTGSTATLQATGAAGAPGTVTLDTGKVTNELRLVSNSNDAVTINGATAAATDVEAGAIVIRGGLATLGTTADTTLLTHGVFDVIANGAASGIVDGSTGLTITGDSADASKFIVLEANGSAGIVLDGGSAISTQRAAGTISAANSAFGVAVRNGAAGAPLVLGKVDALRLTALTVANGNPAAGGDLGPITSTGPVTLGDVNVVEGLTVQTTTAAGAISVGKVQVVGAGQDLVLEAADAGLTTPSDLTANGDVTLTAQTALDLKTITAQTGLLTATSKGGNVGATLLDGDTGVTVNGVSTDIARAHSANGTVGITTSGGALKLATADTDAGTGGGILLTANGATGTVAVTGDLTANGSLQVKAAGPSITLNGVLGAATIGVDASSTTSTVQIDNKVTSGSDYLVTGGSLQLGRAATPTAQSANGQIVLTATNTAAAGTGIVGLGALTLTANADGIDGVGGPETLVLDSAKGITLGGATLLGGPTRESDILIRSAPAADLAFGTVSAAGLFQTDAAHTSREGIGFSGGVAEGRTGAVSFAGPVTLTKTLTVQTAGNIDTKAVTITGANAALVLTTTGAGKITSTGDLNANATNGTIDLTSASGAIKLPNATAGVIDISTGTGDITVTTLTGASLVSAIGGGRTTINTVLVTALPTGNAELGGADLDLDSVTANRDVTLSGGAVSANLVKAGTTLQITADSSQAGTIASSGRLRIVTAPFGAGSIDVGTATSGDAATIGATGGDVRLASLDAGTTGAPFATAASITSDHNVRLGSATARNGALTVRGGRTSSGDPIDGEVTGLDPNAGTVATATGGDLAVRTGGMARITTATADPAGAPAVGGAVIVRAGSLEGSIVGGVTAGADLDGDQGVDVVTPQNQFVGAAISANGPVSLVSTIGDISAARVEATAGSVVVTAGGSILLGRGGVSDTVAGTTVTISSTGAPITSPVPAPRITAATEIRGGGNVKVTAKGGISLTSVRSLNGAIELGSTASTLDLSGAAHASKQVLVSGATVATLPSLESDTADVKVTVGAANITNVVKATDLTVTASSGTIQLGSGTASGLTTLDSSAGGDTITLTGLLKTGTATINSRTDASLNEVQATGLVKLTTGTDARIGTINAAGAAGAIDATIGRDLTGLDPANDPQATLTAGNIVGADVTRTAKIATATATNGVTIKAGSATIGTAASSVGAVALTARAGDLTVTKGSGKTLVAETTGGAGDVFATKLDSTGGALTVSSVSDARLGTITATGGALTITALGGEVTGLPAASGAKLSATGQLKLDAGTLARIDTADSDTGIAVTADRIEATRTTTTAGDISLVADAGDTVVTDATAAGALTLSASGLLNVVNTAAANGCAATLTGGSATIASATARDLLTLTGTAGDLQVTFGQGKSVLAQTTGTGAAAGDVLATTLNSTAGPLDIISTSDARLGTITATGGALTIAALGGQATGLATTDGAKLSATGQLKLDAGTLARIDSAGSDTGIAVTADRIEATRATTTAGDISLVADAGDTVVTDVTAAGALTLSASGLLNVVNTAAANGGAATLTGGSTTINSATASDKLTLTATSGDLQVTSGQGASVLAQATGGGDVLATALDSTAGDVTITSASDARLGTITAVGGDLRVTATAGEVTGLPAATGATLSATGLIDVMGGTLARIAKADAPNGVTISADRVEFTGGTSTAGDVTLTANNGDLVLSNVTASGSLKLTAANLLHVTGVATAQTGSGTFSGGSVEVNQASANTTLAITATAGDLSLTKGDAGGAVTLTALNGAETIGTVSSTGAGITATARSIGIGTATAATSAAGTLDLMTTAGDLNVTTGSGGGDATLASTGGSLILTSLDMGGGIGATSSGDARLGTVTARGGGLTVTATSGQVTGLATTDGAKLSSTGLMTVDAGTLARIDTADSDAGIAVRADRIETNRATTTAGDISLIADAGDVVVNDATAAGGLTLTASGLLNVVNTAAANGGAATLTGGSATINGVTARDALTLTANQGDLQVATGTGASVVAQTTGGGDVLATALNSTGGDVTITSVSDARLGTVGATGGALAVTATGGEVTGLATTDGAKLSSTGSMTVDGGTLARLDTADAGAGIAVTADRIEINRATTTAGDISLIADAGDVVVNDATAAGGLTLTASGLLNVVNTASANGGAATLTGGAATLGTVTARDALTLTANQGDLQVASGSGASVLAQTTGTGDVIATTLNSTGGDVTITSVSDARLGTVGASGGKLTVTAANGEVTGLAGGRADLSASGATSVTGGSRALLGTVSGADVTATAAAIDIASATTGSGALTLTASGGPLTLGQASAATTATLKSTGLATLAGGSAVRAGTALTLTAADADLRGTVGAPTVTLTNNSSNPLLLGDGPSGAGFALSTAEVNNIEAPALVLDAGGQATTIGALAFDADAGSRSIAINSPAEIDVTGTVSAAGPAAGDARLLTIGDAAAAPAAGSVIAVKTTADAGGRILLTGLADLTLNATKIVAGQDGSFIQQVLPTTLDLIERNFVAQPTSTLYNATARGPLNGAAAYTLLDVITANTLTVKYGSYALFQNTAQAQGTLNASGVTANRIVLQALGSPNAVALFGKIGTSTGSSAALLVPPALQPIDVDPRNSRVNGCLIGGGGCLVSTVSPPQINVFDSAQAQVFKSADDLALAFDPFVGANNESLFSDLGTIDFNYEDAKCDPAQDATCAPDTEVQQ